MSIAKLSQGWPKRRYRLGQILIYAGDEVTQFYCVHKGYVKVYSITDEGDSRILLILKPGDLFPLIKDPDSSPQTSLYFYEAMTEVDLHVTNQKEMIDKLRNDSKGTWELLRYISEFSSLLTTRLAQLETKGAEDKLGSLFAYLIEVAGKPTKLNAYLLELKLTHQDIASLIGLTRETVSTEMKKLEKQGRVIYRDGFLLIDNKYVDQP